MKTEQQRTSSFIPFPLRCSVIPSVFLIEVFSRATGGFCSHFMQKSLREQAVFSPTKFPRSLYTSAYSVFMVVVLQKKLSGGTVKIKVRDFEDPLDGTFSFCSCCLKCVCFFHLEKALHYSVFREHSVMLYFYTLSIRGKFWTEDALSNSVCVSSVPWQNFCCACCIMSSAPAVSV